MGEQSTQKSPKDYTTDTIWPEERPRRSKKQLKEEIAARDDEKIVSSEDTEYLKMNSEAGAKLEKCTVPSMALCSPKKMRMAAVSPCTVLTPPIMLSESVLGWLQSGVVAPGLLCAQKVRAPVRCRQALRRERRLEWNVMWGQWCRHHLRYAQGPHVSLVSLACQAA